MYHLIQRSRENPSHTRLESLRQGRSEYKPTRETSLKGGATGDPRLDILLWTNSLEKIEDGRQEKEVGVEVRKEKEKEKSEGGETKFVSCDFDKSSKYWVIDEVVSWNNLKLEN